MTYVVESRLCVHSLYATWFVVMCIDSIESGQMMEQTLNNNEKLYFSYFLTIYLAGSSTCAMILTPVILICASCDSL
jgi:hypothetical protein